jgi:hypothetical protein
LSASLSIKDVTPVVGFVFKPGGANYCVPTVPMVFVAPVLTMFSPS